MAKYVRYSNQGATRNKPLSPELVNALSFLEPMGLTAEVFSGGQDASGPNRTGSHRHDHGGAGDIRFYQGDRALDWGNKDDLPLFEQIVKQGKAAGITGFGAGPGYMGQGTMHLGYGAPGVWGAGGKGANAPEWLKAAFNGTPMPTGVPGTSLANSGPITRPVAAGNGTGPTLQAAAALPATPDAKPTLADRLGTAIWGDKAADLKASFGEGATPNPLNKGLGMLGGAMGGGSGGQSQETQIAPSAVSQTDGADAQRVAAAQQIMSTLIGRKRPGMQLSGRMI